MDGLKVQSCMEYIAADLLSDNTPETLYLNLLLLEEIVSQEHSLETYTMFLSSNVLRKIYLSIV